MKIYYLFNRPAVMPAHGSGEKTHNYYVCKGFEQQGCSVVSTVSYDAKVQNIQRYHRKVYCSLKKYLPKLVVDWLRDLYFIISDAFKTRGLIEDIRIHNPDMIFERITAFHTSGRKSAKKLGIPYVLEMHEMHNCVGFNERVNFKNIRKKMWLGNAKSADLVVVVSGVLRKYLITNGVDENKILVNSNAVDLSLFSDISHRDAIRRKLGIHDEYVLGFVGGMFKYHGIDYLPRLSTYLSRVNIKHKIILIGNMDNYEGGAELFLKQLEAENVVQNFIIIGAVDINDVPLFLSAFDVGLMPDSNVYGSPLKIFEYGAMGLPIVAPSYEPICEVIEDKINGMLFIPGSIESMAKCLEQLHSSPELASNIAKNLKNAIGEKYTWDKYAHRILTSLDNIL